MFQVKTEIGRGLGKLLEARGLSPEGVERLIPVAAAGSLGEAIRVRVETRGDLAGQRFPGWDKLQGRPDGRMVGRRKFVSARYPDRASGRVVKSGAEMYDSSDAYHRANGTRPGTYATTGGMWSGLSRVVWSTTRVDLMFRGRSDGQDARIIDGKSRPLKVSNALKVWTVLAQHGVNVLGLSQQELVQLSEGCVYAAVAGVSTQLPVKWEGTVPTGDVEQIFRQSFRVQREVAMAAAA